MTERQVIALPNSTAPGLRKWAETIAQSAAEALGSAIVIWVLGGLALGIAGSFARNMIPSPPPFLPLELEREVTNPGAGHAWGSVLKVPSFTCFFAVFFAHSLWVRVSARGGSQATSGWSKRMGRIISRLRENWFDLLVGNAIGAWVGAMVLVWVQSGSLTRIIWHQALETLLPGMLDILQRWFGAARVEWLGDLFSWYGDNRMRFNFWFLYFAGAFDDLGVPNLKALARWAWRKRKKRVPTPVTAPGK